MSQFIAVFDASPVNEPTPWMKAACAQAGLTLLDNDAISTALSELPGLTLEMVAEQRPGVGAFYVKAFEKVAKGKQRVAVNSLMWIKHGLPGVSAVVVSTDQIDPFIQAQIAKAPVKVEQSLIDSETKRIKEKIQAAVDAVPKDVLCVVKGSDAEKAKAAVAFLKSKA